MPTSLLRALLGFSEVLTEREGQVEDLKEVEMDENISKGEIPPPICALWEAPGFKDVLPSLLCPRLSL